VADDAARDARALLRNASFPPRCFFGEEEWGVVAPAEVTEDAVVCVAPPLPAALRTRALLALGGDAPAPRFAVPLALGSVGGALTSPGFFFE
jgi:hypothetical protein